MMRWGDRDTRQPAQFMAAGQRPNVFDDLFDSDIWENPYNYDVPDYPLLIDIEPTNNCNFKCKFCNREIMNRQTGNMDMKLYDRIIKQMSGKVNYLKFSRWGEPFLNPHIYDMFKLAKKHMIKVHVTTNGSLVDISKLQDVDTIYFSMQGLNEKEYKDLRGWELSKLREKIETLSKMHDRPHICLSTSVLNEGSSEVRNFIREWSKIVDKVQVGRTTFTWLDKKQYVDKQTFKMRTEPCRDVRLRMSIDWNGDVTPCCTDFDGFLTIGNITEKTLKQLWHSDKLEHIRKQIKEKNFGFNRLCAGCYQQW